MNDLKQAVLDYLDAHQVMTLATQGEDGVWAAAVFYANDEFDFYFLSAGHTRHATHIAAEPRIAAAIHEDYRLWREIKGVQMEGAAQQLGGARREAAIDRYLQKFPEVSREVTLADALRRVNWYRLRPDQLYFIDNSKGFGHRDRIF
ncbi:MAG TPA: pyridoxamine 5'-phosphate oxidase family protein [Candidatus Sulfomarinibacteraceae bacterium]|nr:pyridoxamine 5'-phosphate oxidase family protein [Candidatus Sulfomarinibacteraceae bacterium]